MLDLKASSDLYRGFTGPALVQPIHALRRFIRLLARWLCEVSPLMPPLQRGPTQTYFLCTRE